MRDALSILDQCLSVGDDELTYENIASFLGATDTRFLTGILRAVSEQNVAAALSLIDEFMAAGKNPLLLTENLVETLRQLLLCKAMPDPDKALDTADEYAAELKELASHFSSENILNGMKRLSECMISAKSMKNPRVLLEMAITKMCMPVFSQDTDALVARLGEIERKIQSGISVGVSSAPIKEAEKTAEPVVASEPKEEPKKKEPPKKVELSERLKKIKSAWAEVLELSAPHTMLHLALIQARLYAVDDRICLVFDGAEGAFYKEAASKARQQIEDYIYDCTGFREALSFLGADAFKKEAEEADHLAELIAGGNPIMIE